MVIDNLKHLRDYESLHPLFAKAFDYIEQTDLNALEPGKIVLIEDELFVNVFQWGPKTKDEAKLETHNEYIDVHVPITDGEVMGYTQRCDLPEAEYDVAVDYLERAKPLLSNFKEEGYYYSALGFYNLMVGDSSEAIVNLKHSIELLGQDDFDAKNVHSYFLLQDIYFNQERYKEAYEALMAFAETYTRQHNTSNVVTLSKLINDMELAQADERLKQHQREMQQNQEYNDLVRHIYVGVICFVAAIAILALQLWHMQRKNSRLISIKAEQELRHKNEIIKVQQLQQYEEQNNMTKLSEELIETVNISDNREMRNALRHIIHRLNKKHGSNNNWAEVEKTLANNNDVFFENLLKEYPNLTKNERKLCTLIHMNLSTKEIANITHQSIGSINVARSRLRQKFGLTDSDISLIVFLDKFKN